MSSYHLIFAETSQIERGAILAQHLLDGRALTTAEAAAITGVSVRTAQRDMLAIARVLAIYYDEADNRWRTLNGDGGRISPY